MSRRRFLAAAISWDERVNTIADDRTILLYTWMIAHADDAGMVHGDYNEIKDRVFPLRHDISPTDVDRALTDLAFHDLIIRTHDHICFPPSFQRHQEGPIEIVDVNDTENSKVAQVLNLMPTRHSPNAQDIVRAAVRKYPWVSVEDTVQSMRYVLDHYNDRKHEGRRDWATLFARQLGWNAKNYQENEGTLSFDQLQQQRAADRRRITGN